MSAINSPFDCLIYEGSDAQFHYLHHHMIGGGASYRIPKHEWKPQREFPLGSGQVSHVQPFGATSH